MSERDYQMCTNFFSSRVKSVKTFVSNMVFVIGVTTISGAATADQMISTSENSDSIIKVTLNQATLIRLEDRISDAIVGNPAIADITMQNGKSFVLTGKSYGRTNLMLMNKSGELIFNRSIHVDDDLKNIVRIQRGNLRVSYTCTPQCQPTPTLGDSSDHIAVTANNIKTMHKSIDGAIASTADTE